ncbi:MAG: hypothetical protein U0169_10895 [Polyangiaceae bacterium]
MRNFQAWMFGLVVALVVLSGARAARAGQAQVGKGLGARVDAPLYYTKPSPDDAGAARILYRKSDLPELPPNVQVTSIEFEKRPTSGPIAAGSFTVHIKNSSLTAMTSKPLSEALAGTTQAYTTATLTLPAAAGWVKLDFASPFTYTGDALEVVTAWDSNSGARTEDLPWGVHSTGLVFTTALTYGENAVANDATLGTVSPTRPNTRFNYTSPNAGWLVVEAGGTPLVNGGTYANNTAFSNGVSVPQTIVLMNKGIAPVTLGAVAFTNLVGVTPTVLTPPPAMLAAGASATVVLQHTTNVGSGSVGYGVSIPSDAPSTFTYALQGVSQTAAPEIDLKIVDDGGRFSQVNNNATLFLDDGAVGVARTVRVMVSNFGSGALTLGGSAPLQHVGTTNGMVAIVTQAPTTVAPGTDAIAELTITPTTVGPVSTQIRVVSDDASEATYSVTLKFNGVMASTPTTNAPDIDVAYRDGSDDVPVPTGSRHTRRPGALVSGEGGLVYAILNRGKADLKVGGVSVSNAVNCAPVVDFKPTTIAPNQAVSLTLTNLIASGAGPVSFTVVITSDDPDEPTYAFTVDVTRAVPDIAVYLSPDDHYIETQGPRRDVAFEVRNEGGATLHVSEIFVTGEVGCSILGINPPTMTIAPGGFVTGKLVFEAKTPEKEYADYAFDMSLRSDDPDEPLLVERAAGKVFKHSGNADAIKENPGTANYRPGSCGVSGRSPSGLPAVFALVGLAAVARRRIRRP